MTKGDPLLVRYKDSVYDLSDFAHKHPGGLNTLKGLHQQDMQERFEKAPGHSEAAKYLMKEYKICDKNNNAIDGKSNGHINGLKHGANGTKHANGVIPQTTDDSMEHLVNWNKPMLVQIPTLGKHYVDWVNKPVDRELRLFGPALLENLTKTPWWLVPAFWIPAIGYIIHLGVKYNLSKRPDELTLGDHLSPIVLGCLCFGVLIWTLLEYSLHRWVFHLDPKNNRFLHVFHFLLHGLHHKVPFDPYRFTTTFTTEARTVVTCII